jgi:hypothetical protein
MFSVFYTEDIVRGRDNLGTTGTIDNISEVSLQNQIKDMTNNYGEPQDVAGMLVWSNGRDTFTFSIFKEDKPFNLETIRKSK